jgi:hypothetical protein
VTPEEQNPEPESPGTSLARAYFSSFPPDQQQRILASWGGANLMEEWYQNALSAGAVPPQFRPGAGPTGGSGGGTTPGGAPQWNHRYAEQMQKSYDALIARGVDPAKAERAIRHALGGLPHDYSQNMEWDQGNIAGWGGADYAVNQYLAWQDFYDPNCPADKPYRPDPNHMKELGVGGDASSYCVEKPHDVPEELASLPAAGGGGNGPGGGGNGTTGGAGLTASPQAAASTAGQPIQGGGATVGSQVGFQPGSYGAQPNAAVQPIQVAPLKPVELDAWKATGVGSQPGGAQSALPKIESPYAAGAKPGTFTGGTAFSGGGAKSKGWNGGSDWVASDERLKDLGLELRPRRFSDWRK